MGPIGPIPPWYQGAIAPWAQGLKGPVGPTWPYGPGGGGIIISNYFNLNCSIFIVIIFSVNLNNIGRNNIIATDNINNDVNIDNTNIVINIIGHNIISTNIGPTRPTGPEGPCTWPYGPGGPATPGP